MFILTYFLIEYRVMLQSYLNKIKKIIQHYNEIAYIPGINYNSVIKNLFLLVVKYIIYIEFKKISHTSRVQSIVISAIKIMIDIVVKTSPSPLCYNMVKCHFVD